MDEKSLIYDYIDLDGGNVIRGWLESLPVKVKAKINNRLNALEQISRAEWHTLNTEILHGDKDGLVAIRISYQSIQYRLLGYDGPFRSDFTLLAYCEEHNNKYLPLSIGTTAFSRKAIVEANPMIRRTRHDYR
jgi:hypothetical protein